MSASLYVPTFDLRPSTCDLPSLAAANDLIVAIGVIITELVAKPDLETEPDKGEFDGLWAPTRVLISFLWPIR